MAFYVKDRATDQAVRRLAKLKGKTLTETIREAVEHEYQRERAQVPLIERPRPIQETFAAVCRRIRRSSTHCPETSDVTGRVGGYGDRRR